MTNFELHKKVVITTVIFITSTAVFLSALAPATFYIHKSLDNVRISLIVNQSYCNLFGLFYVTQFILATQAIQSRFNILSEFVTSGHKLTSTSTSYTYAFSQIFQRLCDGIVVINETFTSHLIFILLNALVSPTMN